MPVLYSFMVTTVVSRPENPTQAHLILGLADALAKGFSFSQKARQLIKNYLDASLEGGYAAKEIAKEALRATPEATLIVGHEFSTEELQNLFITILEDPKITDSYIKRLHRFQPYFLHKFDAVGIIDGLKICKAKKINMALLLSNDDDPFALTKKKDSK